jgi:5-methylcytosine-specific restriction endonuclease McrA
VTGYLNSRSEARFPKPAKRVRKPKRRIRRQAKRKAKLHDADKLFSELIRRRDGWACRNCGSPIAPQCAHIVSRRYRATRWSAENAVTLCKADHMRWTHDPLGWEAWVEERFPGRLTQLKWRARAGVAHTDFDELCEALRLAIGLGGAK